MDKLEMTGEELKTLIDAAQKILAGEKATLPDLELKVATKIEAVDKSQAVEHGFGDNVAIHAKPQRTEKDFILTKAIRGLITRDWRGAEMERDWVRSSQSAMWGIQEKSTLEVTDDSLGGFFVPPVLMSELIPLLKAKSVFRAAGARVITDAPLSLNINRQLTASTLYWVGMGAQAANVTESNPTYGQLTLMLRRGAVLVPIDIDLLRNATMAAEQLVRQDLVEQVALGHDLAHWDGAGGTEPRGIRNDPDLHSTSIGGAVTFDHLKDAQTAIDARNGAYNAWITSPTVAGYLRKKKNSVNDYLWDIDPTGKEPNRLLGMPVYTSTQITAGEILLGNFPEFIIAEGGPLEIQILREADAKQLKIDILAVTRIDGVARQIHSFQRLYGITS
jgi:HK97 family phage major capsid protein